MIPNRQRFERGALVLMVAWISVCCVGCGRESVNRSGVQEQVADAGCGSCQFGLDGNGCELAVRMDGKAYFVDGAKLDDFGNAHGQHGMCNIIRKARVSGAIREGRFVASSFELQPLVGETNAAATK
jgi:hypothetical protein